MFVYHLHSDYSNCVTNIDSATKVDMYVERAKELGMTALAFSEHGSALNWFEKKTKIESAGMKYVHGAECYITSTLSEKIRDNYHCILLAKNYDGFTEINRLISGSFNRKDNHYYYVPRISIGEFLEISDNIIVTSACLGGVLNGKDDLTKQLYLDYFIKNKHRCFLEVQHHNVPDQIEYNKRLYDLHKEHGIPMIAGTDTHSLNEKLAEARVVLQRSKNIRFDNEDGWDLTFKSYDELVRAYEVQNSLPKDAYLTAIANTDVVADMVEPFSIDCSPKYPRLYENSYDVFKEKIYKRMNSHPYLLNAVDFMLLQSFIRDWERENGVMCGYSRGSCSGSIIAYILGITEIDSIRFDLNFERFMNPERVSNAD